MKIFGNRKKSYLVIGLICLVSSILGLSYSAFMVSIGNKRASEMYIGNLLYGINIVNEDNTTNGISGRNVTLEVGESKIIKVTLTSLNPVDSKYKLQYKINNGTSDIKYMSTTLSPVKGDIEKETSSNTLEMLIYIENTGSTSSEISFGASGGYTHNDLNQIALITGYTEITEEYFISLHNDLQLALTVDGEVVTKLNKDYFYDLQSFTCQNGSTIEWDTLSSKITIDNYEYQESCTLNFTTSSEYMLLRYVPLGSYVKYTGNNGCTNCAATTSNGAIYTGWRLFNVQGNNPIIVSAGAPLLGLYGMHGYGNNCNNATTFAAYHTEAMKYCNPAFTGSCGTSTSKAMDYSDYSIVATKINNNELDVSLRSLLTIGLDYTLATCVSTGDKESPAFASRLIKANGDLSNYPFMYGGNVGLRPVITLLPNIVVTGGTGTSGDPYIISPQ